MRVKRQFKRLYTRIDKYNLPPSAIVEYKVDPWEIKTVGNGFRRLEYTSKYHYRLYINLWLVELQFDWIGRERAAPRLQEEG